MSEYDKKLHKLIEKVISIGARGKTKDLLKECPEMKDIDPSWYEFLKKPLKPKK